MAGHVSDSWHLAPFPTRFFVYRSSWAYLGPLAIVGADASRLGGYGLTVLMRSYLRCMEVGQKRVKTHDEASLVPSKLAFGVERDPGSEWAAKIGPWVSGGRSGE